MKEATMSHFPSSLELFPAESAEVLTGAADETFLQDGIVKVNKTTAEDSEELCGAEHFKPRWWRAPANEG